MPDARMPLRWWLPALSRFPAQSRLLAWLRRADRLADGPVGYMAGLEATFDAESPIAAAALTRQWMAGDAGDQAWLSADPAWIQPDLNGARLLACGQLGLTMADALALAAPLREAFEAQGMTLEVTRPDRWHVRLPDGPLPTFAAPEQALGEDLYLHLPPGPEGRRWRVLTTELQVILHQHPLNQVRKTQGLPPINSLWLWGAGRLPARVQSQVGTVASDDFLLAALADRAGARQVPLDDADVARTGAGWLIDLQGMSVDAIDTQWWSRIESSARRQRVDLAFASGERWRHEPWHRLRFWRGGRA